MSTNFANNDELKYQMIYNYIYKGIRCMRGNVVIYMLIIRILKKGD